MKGISKSDRFADGTFVLEPQRTYEVNNWGSAVRHTPVCAMNM